MMKKIFFPSIQRERLIVFLICASIYLKQFYTSASGTLQVGDIVLLLALLLVVNSLSFRIKAIDKEFVIFTVLTIIINSIYYLVYLDTRFLLSIAFMIYNCIVIVYVFRPIMKSEIFLNYIRITLILILITQLFIAIAGFGKWMYRGQRYVGTFNDPNQFGFYVLSCLFALYVFCFLTNKRFNIIWIIIAFYEIALSSSTSMLLGLLVFLIFYIILLGGSTKFSIKKAALIIATILAYLLFLLFSVDSEFYKYFGSIKIISRFLKRLGADFSLSRLFTSFLRDRGLRRAVIAPWYFLIGCGEGGWRRFLPIAGEGYEMHSTLIGLAYYYGLIPFCLLIVWMKKNISGIRRELIGVYIALLAESFTLVNHRQPIFWLMFVIASHYGCKRKLTVR